ncbi:MAG: FKBP-type peptidyl-prolyl cis-trans isomerase [Muribaculaceae bacterium]|nr:FKBP-type peptidyl-prolyl cis-trans isomerase [Muribaculaceae bacterium]
MKKLIMGACALFAIAATSCGNCGGDKCETSADSLSTAYGKYVATVLFDELSRFEDNALDSKTDFIKGMQIVFAANASNETRMGMQVALQMLGEIQQMEEGGFEMDKKAVLNAYKNTFLADGLEFDQMQTTSSEFQRLYSKTREEAAKIQEEKDANTPEAIENEKIAEQFLAEVRAENDNVKVSESGLGYLIETPGEGETPSENATVTVHYTGKHINGEVFDTSVERGPAKFNLQGVVPGFREGLTLLAKGGKATLYLPGKLAYGAKGQPAAGIAPNEMLIFEVELIDFSE